MILNVSFFDTNLIIFFVCPKYTDLFLLPRSSELIRQRLKMPKSVNTFFTSWQNIKDPLKLRMVWSCAVYFVLAELEKVETLKKASNALK